MYVAFAPLLIALAAGAFLYIWSKKHSSGFGQFVGGMIMLLSTLLLLLQVMHEVKMWNGGAMMMRDMQKMMHQMPQQQKPAQ